MQALLERVARLEAELAAVKSAAELSRQQLQTRVLVLETRLRAWEGDFAPSQLLEHGPEMVCMSHIDLDRQR